MALQALLHTLRNLADEDDGKFCVTLQRRPPRAERSLVLGAIFEKVPVDQPRHEKRHHRRHFVRVGEIVTADITFLCCILMSA